MTLITVDCDTLLLPVGVRHVKNMQTWLPTVHYYELVTTRSTVDYASVTSIIHCRSCCNFLIYGVINKLQSGLCSLLGYRHVADVVTVP